MSTHLQDCGCEIRFMDENHIIHGMCERHLAMHAHQPEGSSQAHELVISYCDCLYCIGEADFAEIRRLA